MARQTEEALTGREAEVMDAVWRLGEATADQVREALPEPLHDSTVRTTLRVLEGKGYVTHESRGKAYVYRAAVAREKAQRTALGGLLARLFAGSAEDLVMRLIEDEQITPEQLDALRKAVPAKEKKRGKGRTTGG